MTKYNLDFSEFGYREINDTVDLLKAYLNKKNNGYIKDLWLNKIQFDNNQGDVLLIDDNRKKYTVNKGELIEVNGE